MNLQASVRDVRLMHVPVELCHMAEGPADFDPPLRLVRESRACQFIAPG